MKPNSDTHSHWGSKPWSNLRKKRTSKPHGKIGAKRRRLALKRRRRDAR